ncbi:SPOR domain-containing protein [Paracoccus sp. 11-3]|uniref:SPOR domain-containing protein n=1 Tax=Paracoccus amoyensis TaxID=2760093 RepID=A0A926GD71_9RHOB|nr:SPOR domain-containing protein [Paracoccus amoyensis]MBC9245239.1 SPOR domain-containing protein [Paracoccus amoyensis]
MRGWIAILGLVFWPWLAWSQDVPDGFRGAQFIDASGCVFAQENGRWSARLDRDGEQICGFPPTRMTGSHDEPTPKNAGERLQTALADGLRDGDLAADRRGLQERNAPMVEPAQTALQDRVAQQVKAVEAVRTAVAAASPRSSQLCGQLGYVPTAQPDPIIGTDVTQGLCPGMRAPLPEERLISPPVVRLTAPVQQDLASSAAVPDRRPQEARPAEQARPEKTAPSSVIARRLHVADPRQPTVEMIPAGARFVQIGSFVDDQNATIAIRKLSQLGYRVAQNHVRQDYRQARVIMAGPFADRQTLIMALNHLRAAGYPNAIAR